jgi:hypothetical protein
MWYYKKYFSAVVIILFIIASVYIIFNYTGSKITEKQALTICAKLVYESIAENFTITRTNFDSNFRLGESKIDLYITYPNGKKTSSDCIFYSKYKNNNIKLKQALLVDVSGNLIAKYLI